MVIDFLTAPPLEFLGRSVPFTKADYVVIGVPFDRTSTYRPGSRFAPNALREISLNVETYSFLSDIDAEDLRIHDAGNLSISASVEETLERVERAVSEVVGSGKVPILLGGEHTISYGALRALSGLGIKFDVMDLDAHSDARDEYEGLRLSHATFIRRALEDLGVRDIRYAGLRAISRDELGFIRGEGIKAVTALDLKGLGRGAPSLDYLFDDPAPNRYISIDLDVLDPAFAPAVGNPEGCGVYPEELLPILRRAASARVAGIDLCEYVPAYDNGSTGAQGIRLLLETICAMEASKGGR
ncbi:MAG: agmatinase [Candidatus Bathyarchaeia archaeon]